MTTQTFFDFDTPIAINTRVAAARAISPFVATHLRRVLEFIASCGEHGATDEEIFAGTALRESTARARRVDLAKRGQVADSGRRRKTRSGRDAIVWTSTGKPLR
jgi:hypothetical protein